MATDRQILDASISESRAQAASAVGSASSGVGAILAQSGSVNRGMEAIRESADQMRPIADKLQGYGDTLWGEGTQIMDSALKTLGVGEGFMDMDASSSPLVAEALKLYGEFDPDKYVAAASQDVQSQFDNARGQSERNLARMGVNPSSGAYAALQSQLQRSLATARAAAMIRARSLGKTEQATAFQNLVMNPAKEFLAQGGSLASQGANIQGQGAAAQSSAAGVLGDIANLEGSAAKLGLDYGNSLQSAYNALAGMQMSQADNTRNTEALRVSAINGGGGGGGVNIIDKTTSSNPAGWDPVTLTSTYDRNMGITDKR